MKLARSAPRALALAGALECAGALLAAACSPHSPDSLELELATSAAPAAIAEQTFQVPPAPFSEGVFPCTDCHESGLPVNTRRRKLRLAHQEIELRHDEQHRWCHDCHDSTNFDQLHLASGEQVPFEESFRLCGQCHGDKFRDWRAGVHGRRTGAWDGEKQYLLCVHCHDAHAPAFKPLEPMPPPPRPERTP